MHAVAMQEAHYKVVVEGRSIVMARVGVLRRDMVVVNTFAGTAAVVAAAADDLLDIAE